MTGTAPSKSTTSRPDRESPGSSTSVRGARWHWTTRAASSTTRAGGRGGCTQPTTHRRRAPWSDGHGTVLCRSRPRTTPPPKASTPPRCTALERRDRHQAGRIAITTTNLFMTVLLRGTAMIQRILYRAERPRGLVRRSRTSRAAWRAGQPSRSPKVTTPRHTRTGTSRPQNVKLSMLRSSNRSIPASCNGG